MDSLTKANKIIADIEVNKEILSTMPNNNEKNTIKRNEFINEIEEQYDEYKNEIKNILSQRYKKEVNIQTNPEISNFEQRLKIIDDVICLLNEEQTSYERMGLDRNIYKLEKYYKDNFESVNTQIAQCLKKFETVGIKLTKEDFKYSIYVTEYMNTFFSEYEKKEISSNILKTKFEEIYWKCPDIIIHIELNFRNIYLEKKSIIDKYFEKEKNEILKKWDKTPDEIKKTYLSLKQKKMQKERADKKILIDKFLNGKLNIKNYTDDKFEKNAKTILPDNEVKKIYLNNEIMENINKFLNSLYEYRNYMEFKFIIDDVKTYYNNKEQYKKACGEIRKKIETEEKKVAKNNKKVGGFFIFKSKKEQTVDTSAQLIKNIERLYKELDLNTFYEKVAVKMTENSTIQDVLNLAVEYYEYMISCMVKNQEDISQKEMEEKIEKLKDFLSNPYNTIINNISFLEEKDIALIIKDRYKLLNFIIEKEDLDTGNLDSLISVIEDIQTNISLHKVGMNIKDIEQLLKMQKILNSK